VVRGNVDRGGDNEMMSDGFITHASTLNNEDGAEYEGTELHIEDQRAGNGAIEGSVIVEVFVFERNFSLAFDLPEARAFVEAMQEIIDRYPEPPATTDATESIGYE
jgi:hypothetical protein